MMMIKCASVESSMEASLKWFWKKLGRQHRKQVESALLRCSTKKLSKEDSHSIGNVDIFKMKNRKAHLYVIEMIKSRQKY